MSSRPSSTATFPQFSLTLHTPGIFQSLDCATVLPTTRYLRMLFPLPRIFILPTSLPKWSKSHFTFHLGLCFFTVNFPLPSKTLSITHIFCSHNTSSLFSSTDQGWNFTWIPMMILLMPAAFSRMSALRGQRWSFFFPSSPWNPLHWHS